MSPFRSETKLTPQPAWLVLALASSLVAVFHPHQRLASRRSSPILPTVAVAAVEDGPLIRPDRLDQAVGPDVRLQFLERLAFEQREQIRQRVLRAAAASSASVVFITSELHAVVATIPSAWRHKGDTHTRTTPSKCPSGHVPMAATSDRFLKCPRSGPKRPRTVPTWTLEDGSGTLADCVRCLCHAGLDTWTLHRGGCVDL